jgi:hypothetical protein
MRRDEQGGRSSEAYFAIMNYFAARQQGPARGSGIVGFDRNRVFGHARLPISCV